MFKTGLNLVKPVVFTYLVQAGFQQEMSLTSCSMWLNKIIFILLLHQGPPSLSRSGKWLRKVDRICKISWAEKNYYLYLEIYRKITFYKNFLNIIWPWKNFQNDPFLWLKLINNPACKIKLKTICGWSGSWIICRSSSVLFYGLDYWLSLDEDEWEEAEGLV